MFNSHRWHITPTPYYVFGNVYWQSWRHFCSNDLCWLAIICDKNVLIKEKVLISDVGTWHSLDACVTVIIEHVPEIDTFRIALHLYCLLVILGINVKWESLEEGGAGVCSNCQHHSYLINFVILSQAFKSVGKVQHQLACEGAFAIFKNLSAYD